MIAKKHRLGDTPADLCVLFGIVSGLPDYRLAHYLNEVLDLHLKRIPDLNAQAFKDGKVDHYTTFYARGEENLSHFYLFANKGQLDRLPLFPSLKNIDFALMMVDESENRLEKTITPKTIREIHDVSLAQRIDLSKVPNADLVMNLAELHILELSRNQQMP